MFVKIGFIGIFMFACKKRIFDYHLPEEYLPDIVYGMESYVTTHYDNYVVRNIPTISASLPHNFLNRRINDVS